MMQAHVSCYMMFLEGFSSEAWANCSVASDHLRNLQIVCEFTTSRTRLTACTIGRADHHMRGSEALSCVSVETTLHSGGCPSETVLILCNRIPEECPAQIAQLYMACLSELPQRRPKAADLVRVILGALDGSAATASVNLGSQSGAGGVSGAHAHGPARLFFSLRRCRG